MDVVVDKEIDSVFSPDEKLYRALEEGWFEGNVVLNLAVRLPSSSVNRSKYSQPEDVLDSERPLLVKVAGMSVGDLPGDYKSSANKISAVYSFCVDHLPYIHNRAHSELRVSQNGEYREKRKFSPGVKKALRQMLAKKMSVL